jgi:hypothetical protein
VRFGILCVFQISLCAFPIISLKNRFKLEPGLNAKKIFFLEKMKIKTSKEKKKLENLEKKNKKNWQIGKKMPLFRI